MISSIIIIVLFLVFTVIFTVNADKGERLLFCALSLIFSVIISFALILFTGAMLPADIIEITEEPAYCYGNQVYYVKSESEDLNKFTSDNLSIENVNEAIIRVYKYDNTYICKMNTYELVLPEKDFVDINKKAS